MPHHHYPDFPAPVTLTPGCTRWALSDLLRYEARKAGKPEPVVSPDDEIYLTDRQVARRYGVARCTPWDWCRKRTTGAAA